MTAQRGLFKNTIGFILGVEMALLLWHLLRMLVALVLLALLIHFTIGFPLVMDYVRAALLNSRRLFSEFQGSV